LKQKLTLCAGLLALVLADCVPAAAQLLPAYPGPAALPPYEIMAIVRSRGFDPLQGPVRRGPVYWVHAIDPAGQDVRVVVNAHMGRIVRVVPVGMRYAAPMPPPYARPPGAIPMAPYGRNPRMMGPPDDEFDDPVGSTPGRAAQPNPSATPRLSTAPSQPPLPRPRPKLAATDITAPSPAPKEADNRAATVKPPAPAAAAAKPAASPTDGAGAKPPAPHEE